ncbi:hypothetical protein B0H11DRAFT_2282211 [Mycena galericulata]|nr:hypothetical protein B0H11DRAFT_2282211 [Mycena galericulata]
MGFLPGSSHHKSSQVFWAQKYSGDTSRRSRPPSVTCQDECILELHSRQTNCTRSCNISRLQMNLNSSPCSTSMGLSHSVLPTQSSIPTAFAPSKLFTRFIQFNWHSTLASATALGQYVLPPFPPAVIDPTPNQGVEMQVRFLSSPPRRSHTWLAPHPFSSAPHQQLKDSWVGGSPWRTCAYTMCVTAARYVALPHLGGSISMPLCANSRGPKKRRICALLRHVQDPVVGSAGS